MKILIAEDDRMSRTLLERNLTRWGHEVELTTDGLQAWDALQNKPLPQLAILDWMMPGIDGVEVCRRVRRITTDVPLYIILLTAKGSKSDIVEGLIAGANDYVTKPFDREELQARIQVGATVVGLHAETCRSCYSARGSLRTCKTVTGHPAYMFLLQTRARRSQLLAERGVLHQ